MCKERIKRRVTYTYRTTNGQRRSTNGQNGQRTSNECITDKTNMYSIKKQQKKKVYRTIKERIYRSKRMKRISSDIGHEVHSRYCVRDCSHFLKFSLICMNM